MNTADLSTSTIEKHRNTGNDLDLSGTEARRTSNRSFHKDQSSARTDAPVPKARGARLEPRGTNYQPDDGSKGDTFRGRDEGSGRTWAERPKSAISWSRSAVACW